VSQVDAPVDVGILLSFALEVTAAPGSAGLQADYARLVRRYLDDAAFRALFDGVVEGAGCTVTTADPSIGVVLRTRPDGPWAWPARSAELPWSKAFEDPKQRAARALVVLALLAYVAPAAADLDDLLADPDVVLTTVGVRDLEQFIRDFCEQSEAKALDPAGDDESRPLWWHWVQMPAEAPTAKRISRGTTTYVVYDVLSFLNEAGWLVDATPSRAAVDKQYRPRRRLIHHYRDLLLDDVFGALRRHADAGRGSIASSVAGRSERVDGTAAVASEGTRREEE
jgi:hypothetical protein